MIAPAEADIGRAVIYRRDSPLPGESEAGVITSFSKAVVFVRYGSGLRGIATSPSDLDWAFPSERTP
jgi:hypothetical protein